MWYEPTTGHKLLFITFWTNVAQACTRRLEPLYWTNRFSIFTIFAKFVTILMRKSPKSGTKFETFRWAVGITTKFKFSWKTLALDEVRFWSVPFRCRCVFTNDSTKKFQHLKKEVTFGVIGNCVARNHLTFRDTFSKHAFGNVVTSWKTPKG